MLKLMWGLVLLNVFNVIDAVFTLNAITYGAVEVNPIMNALLKCGPFVFLVVKIFIFILATPYIYQMGKRLPDSKVIKYGVGFAFIAYFLLTIYHFVIFTIIMMTV